MTLNSTLTFCLRLTLRDVEQGSSSVQPFAAIGQLGLVEQHQDAPVLIVQGERAGRTRMTLNFARMTFDLCYSRPRGVDVIPLEAVLVGLLDDGELGVLGVRVEL